MKMRLQHGPQDLEKLVPLIERTMAHVPDYSLEDFLRFLAIELVRPSGFYHLWSIWEEEAPLGYVLVLAPVGLSNSVHILHACSIRKDASIALEEAVEEFTRLCGVSRITMVTTRSPEAFSRSHGYKLQSYLMVKELKNGE